MRLTALRLLFVCKRHPQQRDLVTRPYGRFFHLPTALAARGHEVAVTLCSHRGLPSERFEHAGVDWASEDVRTGGPARFIAALEARGSDFRPDWVIGCSDTWYGILGRRIARHSGARLAIDAYDNYEAYMPWNLPLHWAWRRAVRAADLVTAAGPQLAARLDGHRSRGRPGAQIVPMAADPMFVPGDRIAARVALGLPIDAPLVGYSGGWAGNRGTHVLLEAFRLVRAQQPEARLVLTGRPPPVALAEPGVFPLGYLPDATLPVVLSAIDVACVITADTSFGRYSYPAKLCEAMACEVPVVATATEPVRWMLHDDAPHLAKVGDPRSIADRLLRLLGGHRVRYRDLPTWEASADALEQALQVQGRSSSV
jgi:glycosyltransferase involved in cell wall biosynthesis